MGAKIAAVGAASQSDAVSKGKTTGTEFRVPEAKFGVSGA